ncbi:DoxX family protein [Bacillus sp. ChL18]|uniref:DoxX family protein n=1 Tax=Bacillus TaxID=1386 RepID=UPI0022488297|nr:DoxX family protein [Bacillus sp. ChL18]MCX2811836.1 DoxX family protein [Bacillus sp. ChL18]
MSTAILLVRILLGLTFIGHGLQKTTGGFGGNGWNKTVESFANMKLKPPKLMAFFAASSEIVGGGVANNWSFYTSCFPFYYSYHGSSYNYGNRKKWILDQQ